MRSLKLTTSALLLAALAACSGQPEDAQQLPPDTLDPNRIEISDEQVMANHEAHYPILVDVKSLNALTSRTLEAQLLGKCGPPPSVHPFGPDTAPQDLSSAQARQKAAELESLMTCRKKSVSQIIPDRKNEISETRLLRPDITNLAMEAGVEASIMPPANLRHELAEYAATNKQIQTSLEQASSK